MLGRADVFYHLPKIDYSCRDHFLCAQHMLRIKNMHVDVGGELTATISKRGCDGEAGSYLCSLSAGTLLCRLHSY